MTLPEDTGPEGHGVPADDSVPADNAPAEGSPGDPQPSRRRRWIVLALLLALLGWDVSRTPGDQVSARVLLAGIDLYQATASRWMPGLGVHCRFTPTCSHFAEGAIRRDGALLGSLRAAGRLLRCGPWTEAGTVDPP